MIFLCNSNSSNVVAYFCYMLFLNLTQPTFACRSCCFTCWDLIFSVFALLCLGCCILPLHGSLFYSAVHNLSLKRGDAVRRLHMRHYQFQMHSFAIFFLLLEIALTPIALVQKFDCEKILQEIAKANSKGCSKIEQTGIVHKRSDVTVGL